MSGDFSFKLDGSGQFENFLGVAPSLSVGGPLLVNGEPANGDFTCAGDDRRKLCQLPTANEIAHVGGVTVTVVATRCSGLRFSFRRARKREIRLWLKTIEAIKERPSDDRVRQAADIRSYLTGGFGSAFHYFTGDARDRTGRHKRRRPLAMDKRSYPGIERYH